MLTITHHERHDCPNCNGTRLVMIGRTSFQIALRCLKCGNWFAIEPKGQAPVLDDESLTLAGSIP